MFDSMVVGRIRFLVVLRTLVLHWLLALSTPGLLKAYPQSTYHMAAGFQQNDQVREQGRTSETEASIFL